MRAGEELTEKHLVDRMLSWYESQPWFRALIQAVPFAGGSADTLLAWRAVNINKRRVEELFRNISERLSSVEESTLNKEFLQSEEFFELLRNCAEVVTRSVSDFKRKHVADFLATSIRQGRIHDLSQQIAEDLRVLQDFHLQILRFLPQSLIPNVLAPENEREVAKVIDLHALKEMTGLDQGVYNKGISDLERLGFIHYTSEGTSWVDGDIRVCRPTGYLAIFKISIEP